MPPAYRFGHFVIDRASYRLTRDGEPLELSPKALDLLFLFADRPGTLVTKDDMLAALWPGLAVTDNALTQVVSDVRQALGDDPLKPRFVQTVPRRGYRFVADVAPIPSNPASASPPAGRTIAVADFVNVAKDAGVAWLSAGIAETVTNALRAMRELSVIDRELLARARPGDGRADVLVTGSFQRFGDELRITAEAVDARSRETLAHAKADGALSDVFRLQDEIVSGLMSGLRLVPTPVAAARVAARETSSLEAYRALTEGRLKLETLELADVPGAIADFERAIRLDPQYALAYVGLAHARFWKFQASRARTRPDREELGAAIGHARRAVELDPELAEGHAALALFLAAAERRREAVTAGRIAVALEPNNWRHQFRLGIAAWGSERLTAMGVVVAQYPALPYANVGIAMVHVARGENEVAESVVRRGLAADGAAADPAGRFPGRGLNWLLGLIRLAAGDVPRATAELERELAAPSGAMHADEYAVDAADGLGFMSLTAGEYEAAAAWFNRALARNPDHPRSLVGLAQSWLRRGQRDRAGSLLAHASRVIDEMSASGREGAAMLPRAQWHLAHGRSAEAMAGLGDALDKVPNGPAGWSIPIEPWLAAERGTPAFAEVLSKLADRAK
jgi:DNA-binding winged helix-turn-helix (wHTH) protein/tetratricopeptide (TPR) repeat protein